jgi:hypothetical protein
MTTTMVERTDLDGRGRNWERMMRCAALYVCIYVSISRYCMRVQCPVSSVSQVFPNLAIPQSHILLRYRPSEPLMKPLVIFFFPFEAFCGWDPSFSAPQAKHITPVRHRDIERSPWRFSNTRSCSHCLVPAFRFGRHCGVCCVRGV